MPTILFLKQRANLLVHCLTIQALFNRPFPSCLLPLCQNESKNKTIRMIMCSPYRFFFMQIKLVLKQRHKVTQEWPVLNDVRERKLRLVLLYTTLSYLVSALVPSLSAFANFFLKRTETTDKLILRLRTKF